MNSWNWRRFDTAGRLLALCLLAAGCSEVLGINDPEMRNDAGAGTAGSLAESGAGGDLGTAGHGGSAGKAGSSTAGDEGGEAGSAVTMGGSGGDGGTSGGGTSGSGGGGSGGLGEAGEAGAGAVCTNGDTRCVDNQQQTCTGGMWGAGKHCDSFCSNGSCATPNSCSLLSTQKCRVVDDCCEADLVEGGTFYRDYDASGYGDMSYPATLNSFLLDKYEVTLGRMQAFVNAYPASKPSVGAGKSAYIAEDTGWQDSYPLPTHDDLVTQLKCDGHTWSDTLLSAAMPANCVSYYVAYAFCIWDGGRLPTEAEWNYAAAGGDEQRVYPWSSPPEDDQTVNDTYAIYSEKGTELIAPVGTATGDGRWGHADLSGNLAEWVLDYYVDTYPSNTCLNCMTAAGQTFRSQRGGAFDNDEYTIRPAMRNNLKPDQLQSYSGFRCVHELPLASKP